MWAFTKTLQSTPFQNTGAWCNLDTKTYRRADTGQSCVIVFSSYFKELCR